MANNRDRARARRQLQKVGLPAVTIPCQTSWTEILADQGMLPFWRDGKALTVEELHTATEKLMSQWCRDWQREKAEAMLSGCEKIRTGALAREPAPDPKAVSWVPSAGGHWSYRPGGKKDKGRKFTSEEIKAYLKEHPEIEEKVLDELDVIWRERCEEIENEVSEAEATADIGMRVVGDW